MIDSAQILSQRMVDRYLAGQLSAEETAEFESYMLEHPELLDEIDVTRRLKLGLRSLRHKGEIEGLLKGNAVPARGRYLALAASVLIAVGFASWYLSQRVAPAGSVLAATLESFGSRGASLSLDDLLLVRTRSGAPIEVEMPATPRLLRVQMLAPTDAEAFSAQLLRKGAGQEPEAVQELNGLRADTAGMVSMYFDPGAAGRGEYVIRLAGHRADGSVTETQEYELELK